MKTENGKCNACGCSAEAVTAEFKIENTLAASKIPRKKLEIEFLYLDLKVCEPCRGSEANLVEALEDVAGVIEKTGVKVEVRKIHVESFEQALQLGFVNSSAIRVNGRDPQLEVKENHCPSCSRLSNTATNCRVWGYQGRQCQAAPKAMIIEALLKALYGGGQSPDTIFAPADKTNRSLENLKNFFESRNEKTSRPNAAAGKACGC